MMPFAIPFLCALTVPAGLGAWGMWRRLPLSVVSVRVALAAYLALLFALTATPSPFGQAHLPLAAGTEGHFNLVPLDSIRRYVVAAPRVWTVELLGNVAAFVPFGLLLSLVWRTRRRWGVLLAGVGLSLAIEVTQYLLVPMRVADIDDVLLNVLGTAIGVALVLAFLRVANSRVGRAVRSTPARSGPLAPQPHARRPPRS